jgi:hypothetical protein
MFDILLRVSGTLINLLHVISHVTDATKLQKLPEALFLHVDGQLGHRQVQVLQRVTQMLYHRVLLPLL